MTSDVEKPPSKRGGYRPGAGRKPTTPDDEDRLRIGWMCEQQLQAQLKCQKADWELNSFEPLRLLTDAVNAIPVSERATSLRKDISAWDNHRADILAECRAVHGVEDDEDFDDYRLIPGAPIDEKKLRVAIMQRTARELSQDRGRDVPYRHVRACWNELSQLEQCITDDLESYMPPDV